MLPAVVAPQFPVARGEADDSLARLIEQRFGYPPRAEQRALIERTLAGKSSLGIMPTGAGKSLAFQATAALVSGTVLVVSPLLSLMRDQVEKLGAVLHA